jgi:CheY-like chemotaxis protein
VTGTCHVCGRRFKQHGFYPLKATVNLAQPRELTLCSAVCLIRLLQSLRRPGPIPGPDVQTLADGPVAPSHSTDCWILLVDDDYEIREVVSEVLVERGYHPVAVADGQQALSCLHDSPTRPCLILLDIMMPGMDGVAFRHHQLTDPDLASIPVVVVSAGTPPETGFEGAAVVRKPLQLHSLLQLVAECCPPPYLGPRGLPA